MTNTTDSLIDAKTPSYVPLFDDPALIAAAADHTARLAGTPFVNPIPDDIKPSLPTISPPLRQR